MDSPLTPGEGDDELDRALMQAERARSQASDQVGELQVTLSLRWNVWGLHFYLDSDEERCFIEELPSSTIVEGRKPYSQIKGGELSYVKVIIGLSNGITKI
ncbi:7855_t:CDS:2, partial [Acaulospora colombiana]